MAGAWARLVWNSVGVAAAVAAAELGVAQALGIVRWDTSFEAGNGSAWNALLTWIAFIYAVAVLCGAIVGRRAIRRPGRPEGLAARITAVTAATIGAAIAAILAWVPARGARPPVSVDPELVVAMTAGAGVVVGAVVSLAAVSAAPVAGGVRAAFSWVWLVAIGSAAAELLTERPHEAPRLGVLDAPSLVPPGQWWSGPSLMIAIAGVVGVVVAAFARWGGASRLGISLSGVAGPAVIAAAYLIAGPGMSGDRADQIEPYRAALIAVAAGLCAAVLVALPGRRAGAGPADQPATPDEGDRGGLEESFDPTAGEPHSMPMGQPRSDVDNDYAEWLGGLGQPGHTTARR